MSDEVPELSPEAKAFLARHEATGEPTPEGLERGRQRAVSLTRGVTPVAPARLRRSTWLPPEVMAAAAVVAIVLGLQVLYLVFRTPPAAAEWDPAAPEVKAVAEAWRAGDLERANRLASKDCRGAACASLASDLGKALGLAQRVYSLSPAELDELAAFDAKLTGGRQTQLRTLLEERRKDTGSAPLSDSAEVLFQQATAEKRAKNFERAAVRLEKCVKLSPPYQASL